MLFATWYKGAALLSILELKSYVISVLFQGLKPVVVIVVVLLLVLAVALVAVYLVLYKHG